MEPIPSSSSSLAPDPSRQPRRSSRIVQSLDITQPLPRHLPEPSYPYSFDLLAHHGCIAPVASFDGPAANVFSIDFSADGRRLAAAGLDSRIFIYDPSRSSAPSSSSQGHSALSVLTPHTESCRRVAFHPQESTCLLSAAEDGHVFHHDLRTPEKTTSRALLEARAQYTDLCWNPVSTDLFIASTGHTIKLYDRRKLGSAPTTNVNRYLVSYTTNLIKPKPLLRIGHPEISSVTIDPSGQLLGVMMSKWYPTIWTMDDPNPLAVLKSEPTVPVGGESQVGFRDVCTIKHGAFSNKVHSDSTYFAGGSDDFRCYGWKLPAISEMESKRHEVERLSDWMNETTADTFVKVHSARRVGWYPHQTSHSRAQPTSTTVRRKMSVADRIPFIFGPSHRSQQLSSARPEEEDLETLAMFDALLEREKEVGEHSLWMGLEQPDDELDDEDDDGYFSYDDFSD
ncbi:hypothetical protein PTTG_09313 [Puccinia triticina 1-1 BBBD Race 1]|uniref:WD_REPEATS_REGION domain-containing protein n=1 Tax=Puccinia triticina (isolate 1-1 / race 1 (BBBD)) TaxID=630390 RepID=A0A180GZW3_PUCT1|nr:hypothetical protein PTTG_09313 [Puccinia triticina 1-1 BBBD Race 1]